MSTEDRATIRSQGNGGRERRSGGVEEWAGRKMKIECKGSREGGSTERRERERKDYEERNRERRDKKQFYETISTQK